MSEHAKYIQKLEIRLQVAKTGGSEQNMCSRPSLNLISRDR